MAILENRLEPANTPLDFTTWRNPHPESHRLGWIGSDRHPRRLPLGVGGWRGGDSVNTEEDVRKGCHLANSSYQVRVLTAPWNRS